MKIRTLLSMMALFSATPSQAATYVITYDGTLISGTDEFGTFGSAGANLAGIAFEATYILTTPLTGALFSYSPSSTSIFGGSDYGAPSPVSATLTINGLSFGIDGNYQGAAYQNEGSLGGAGDRIAYTVESHGASHSYRMNSLVFSTVNNIVNGSDPTSPVSYNLVSGDGYQGGFGLFGNDPSNRQSAQGTFRINSVSVAELASAVPEPATWVIMLLGFGLIGSSMRYRKRPKIDVRYT